jgi:hypothetical protein
MFINILSAVMSNCRYGLKNISLCIKYAARLQRNCPINIYRLLAAGLQRKYFACVLAYVRRRKDCSVKPEQLLIKKLLLKATKKNTICEKENNIISTMQKTYSTLKCLL